MNSSRHLCHLRARVRCRRSHGHCPSVCSKNESPVELLTITRMFDGNANSTPTMFSDAWVSLVHEIVKHSSDGSSELSTDMVPLLQSIIDDNDVVQFLCNWKFATMARLKSNTAKELKSLKRAAELQVPKWFAWKDEQKLIAWNVAAEVSNPCNSASAEAAASLWWKVLAGFQTVAEAVAPAALPPPTPAASSSVASGGDAASAGGLTLKALYEFISTESNPNECTNTDLKKANTALGCSDGILITEPFVSLIKDNLKSLLTQIFIQNRSLFWYHVRREYDQVSKKPVIILLKKSRCHICFTHDWGVQR